MSGTAQNEETSAKNDPVEAFLTLKHITERDTTETRLRKLGNIVKESELTQWPYKDMVRHLQTIHELTTTFCFGGIVKLNREDASLRLHARDKRYIPDMTNASMQAHLLNQSRPWHEAGPIGNPIVPIIEAQCQEHDGTSMRSSNSAKVCSSFRMQLLRHTYPESGQESCLNCKVKDKAHEAQQGDIPTFFQTLSEEISREFADGYHVVLVPDKLFLVGRGQHVQKTQKEISRDDGMIMGFVILALPTFQEGGGFRVYFGDSQEEFNFAEKSKDSSNIQWVAFRPSCKYEVLPVKRGTCTILMYEIRRLPIRLTDAKLCKLCQPKPASISRIETPGRRDPVQGVEKFCQEVRKNVRVSREKKLGIFLQNNYSMCDFGPGSLCGVDRLMYEDLSDLEVVLTPVLCYIDEAIVTNHLMRLQITSVPDKCVYSFSMADLRKLQATRRSDKEDNKDEEVPFIGSESASEVELNKGKSEPEGLPLLERQIQIRWSLRCAMIVSGKKKQKSPELHGTDDTTSGNKKKRGRSKGRKSKAKSALEVAERKKSDSQEDDDKKEKDEEGATAANEGDNVEGGGVGEEQKACSACGKHETEVEDPLRRCTQCLRTQYCSRKCQRDDWKGGHKYSCGKYAMQLD